MSAQDNGGPVARKPKKPTHDDILLRDYFAGKALQGELASQHPDFGKENYSDSASDKAGLAAWCYGMADAMLAARSK